MNLYQAFNYIISLVNNKTNNEPTNRESLDSRLLPTGILDRDYEEIDRDLIGTSQISRKHIRGTEMMQDLNAELRPFDRRYRF